MAAAMARGWSRAGELSEGVVACDGGSGRATELAAEVGGVAVDSPTEVMDACDVVVLATKPATLPEVAPSIAGRDDLIISVLAGVDIATLEESLHGQSLIRAMPNVCVEVCEGVTCWSAGDSADGPQRDQAARLLEALGSAVEIPEGAMDAATAAMSCSVAYFALVAEELADAASREGLEPEVAREVVARTLAGTGTLLGITGAGQLSDAVASPGGATEAGLEELRAGGVRASLSSAVAASIRRMRG